MRLPHGLALLALLALPAQAQAPKPTPHHEAMKGLEGTWDVVVKMHMGPGKPPAESKGVEVNRLCAGGLWLETDFTSTMMGAPFEGHGVFGYDTAAQRHVGTWVDNSGTWAANSVGTCKHECREMTSTFQGRDEQGRPAQFKEVSTQPDADHRTMVMSTKGKDGKFHVILELAYTRRK